MRKARGGDARTRREAAEWFTRLSQPSVTTQSIQAFRAWRRDPGNRAAYDRLEAIWDAAGALTEDPDVQALRLQTRARTVGAPRRRVVSWGALATAGAAGLAALLFHALSPAAYESGLGEQRIVRLADGSVLRLNTDSRVSVKLGDERRDVRLERGQALFEVAHDPSRPFVVRAGRAEVRALGTVFDVRMADRKVDVTLVEGSVQVSTPSGGRIKLRPDERVQVRDGALEVPAPTDADREISWTDRRLIFQQTPLAEAVAEVNRYSKRKVELEAPDLADAPVNGVFATGDTEAFAAAAASVFDLQVVDRGSSALVLRRPAARAY